MDFGKKEIYEFNSRVKAQAHNIQIELYKSKHFLKIPVFRNLVKFHTSYTARITVGRI